MRNIVMNTITMPKVTNFSHFFNVFREMIKEIHIIFYIKPYVFYDWF